MPVESGHQFIEWLCRGETCFRVQFDINHSFDLIRRPIFKSWLRRETVLQNWPAGAGDEVA
jgi:hypothetical protein